MPGTVQEKLITLDNLERYNNHLYEEMSQDDYQEITPEANKTYFIPDYDNEQSVDASAITYSNTTSGLQADNVQDAIDELNDELNGENQVYDFAPIITIEDNKVPSNLADCSVKIEPVQDLHGQSAPYVGGAWKNKLPMSVDVIKLINTSGTWNGNVYSENGATATVLTDNDGNVTGFKVEAPNTPSSTFLFNVCYQNTELSALENVSVTMNGCPANGSSDSYAMQFYLYNGSENVKEYGSGVTFTPSNLSSGSRIRIVVKAATPSGGLLFYPMLRLATETDNTFAPYTNICPITGHTEASVQRDGKNIFDVSTYPFTDNYFIHYINGDAIGSNTGFKCTFGYIPIIAYRNKTLTLNKRPTGGDTAICFYDSNKLYLSGVRNNNAEANTPWTFQVPNNAVYMRFTTALSATDVQIEVGAETTPYVPYAGKTYTIALGSTIYGGTVDFDSGVMTVTHKYMKVTNLTRSNNTLFYKILSDAGVPNNYTVLCDREKTANQWGDVGVFTDQYGAFMLKTAEEYTSAADCLIAYGGELNICYELATPTTIHLTPQQIQLLKGTNTLTASTGQISVTVNGVSGSIGAVQEQVNGLQDNIGEINNILSLKTATAGTNITIVKGGYLQIGKLVIIDAIVTADDDISVNQGILQNMPAIGNNNCPLSCFDVSSPWAAVNVRVYQGSVISTDQLTSGHSYHIYGSYMCN